MELFQFFPFQCEVTWKRGRTGDISLSTVPNIPLVSICASLKIEQFGPIFLVKSWTIHLFFQQLCLTVFVLIWVFSFLSLFWTISLLVTKNLGMNNPFFETLSLFSFFIFVDNNPTYYKKLMLKDKCDLGISKHIRYVIKLWCAGCSIMSTYVSLIFSNIMHAGFIPFLLFLSWYFFTVYKFRVFEPFINTLRHLLNSLY